MLSQGLAQFKTRERERERDYITQANPHCRHGQCQKDTLDF